MKMNTVVSGSRKTLVLLSCVWLGGGVAWADSGMRIKEGPIQVTPGNPPADQARITTYQVTLENENCTCNEAVRISRWLPDNPTDGAVLGKPIGSFEFLGFKDTAGGSLSSKLEFPDIEDESTQTFFFDIKTGPNKLGCFFESAEFTFIMCDYDGGCDCCDGPCEGPTPYKKTVRLEAATLPSSSPGTATLTGTVTDSAGDTVVGALVRVRRGCPGDPGAVNQQTFTRPRFPQENWCTPNCKGKYQIPTLPAGTYTVSARSAKGCAKANVTIANGASVTQNFTLNQTICADVEEP